MSLNVRRLTVSAVAMIVVAAGLSVFMVSPAFAALEYSKVGQFGGEGPGDGQFIQPSAIAVDEASEASLQPAAGDVYVFDAEDQRVERFSASGVYLSQWDGSETQAKSFYTGEGRIAVDNSNNPLDLAVGDVYVADHQHSVIDQFTPEGVFTGLEIKGGCAAPGVCPGKEIPFSEEISGLTVDASGDLWAVQYNGIVDEFNDNGEFVQNFSIGSRGANGAQIDAEGHLYTRIEFGRVSEFEGANDVADFFPLAGVVTSLALNTTSDELLLDKGTSVERVPLGGGPGPAVETFGTEEIEDSYAMAVNGASPKRTVYVLQRKGNNVEIFNYADFPKVVTGAASEASETGMSLQGKVNPEGEPVTECFFEYGTTSAYGQSVPCEQSPGAIGEGVMSVSVSARLSGLPSSSTRHFRLVAVNANGTKYGHDVSIGLPSFGSVSASSVGASEATLETTVVPGGSSTVYSVEYGTSLSYGHTTGTASAGAGAVATSVRARLAGLQAGTHYHVRFTATNEIGTVTSEDFSFTTTASGSATASTLPDGRAYELVSTANRNDLYRPDINGTLTGSEEPITSRPFRASSDGEKIAYLAEPPTNGGSGSQGLGEEFLARRSSSGWVGEDIVPAGASVTTKFQTFSDDLSIGILEKGLHLNNNEVADDGQCDQLIAHGPDGKLHPFFTSQPAVSNCGEATYFAGASANYSHLLFESQAGLVEGAEQATEQRGYNLYDSVDGQLQLVNVLPGPNPQPDPNAVFGGPHTGVGSEGNPPGFSNVISDDGSRIFWTDRNTGMIYMRLDGETTVPVSAGVGRGRYWTATPDGADVFYVEEGRLWRFNVDRYLASGRPEAEALGEAREPLTGEGAGVVGVIGINETGEDGAYVYFVAEGVLASNKNGNGETAIEEAPNLYLRHGSETKFVATLTPEDNALEGPISGNSIEVGDWQHNLGDRTAEVTPDGHVVSFLSHASLTGYDNKGVIEAYVYDASAGEMFCASCSPTGAAAVSRTWVPVTDTGLGNTYMERWLSADGNRVFFETRDPVLPLASNGLMNVYEWERDGTGSCTQARGCVFLLSGGGSTEESVLADASADGDDVFFVSREDFVPEAQGEAIKLYDARVGGGFQVSRTSCTGSGCQGVPPAPPIFATPSSVTFNGVGNFESPPPVVSTKPKEKKASGVGGRLAKALAICRKKSKHKRHLCEKRARKRYASASKKGKR